jgi:hypothetical protein
MPLFLFSNAQTMFFLVDCTQQHCTDFLKNLIPWRDSNPGLLFLRRMRCQLRHAARADSLLYFRSTNCNKLIVINIQLNVINIQLIVINIQLIVINIQLIVINMQLIVISIQLIVIT